MSFRIDNSIDSLRIDPWYKVHERTGFWGRAPFQIEDNGSFGQANYPSINTSLGIQQDLPSRLGEARSRPNRWGRRLEHDCPLDDACGEGKCLWSMKGSIFRRRQSAVGKDEAGGKQTAIRVWRAFILCLGFVLHSCTSLLFFGRALFSLGILHRWKQTLQRLTHYWLTLIERSPLKSLLKWNHYFLMINNGGSMSQVSPQYIHIFLLGSMTVLQY